MNSLYTNMYSEPLGIFLQFSLITKVSERQLLFNMKITFLDLRREDNVPRFKKRR